MTEAVHPMVVSYRLKVTVFTLLLGLSFSVVGLFCCTVLEFCVVVRIFLIPVFM